jgi:U3 small nucleolar RNA-associated protein MPP10
MSDDQVWEQLDLRNRNICQMLELILDGQKEDGELELSMERLGNPLKSLEDGEDIDLDDFLDGMSSDEDSLDHSDDGEEDTGSGSSVAEDNAAEDVVGLRDPSSSEGSDYDEFPFSMIDETPRHNVSLSKKGAERSESQLDDGFFNLASFNAETERAEAKTSSSGHLGGEEDSDDDDISLDLFTSLDQVEPTHDQGDIGEAKGRNFSYPQNIRLTFFSEVFYHDFFEPLRGASLSRTNTASKKNPSSGQVRFHEEVKVTKIKARGKNLPVSLMEDEDCADEDDEDDDDDAVVKLGKLLFSIHGRILIFGIGRVH